MKRRRRSIRRNRSGCQGKRSLGLGAQRQRPWDSESSGQHSAGDVVMASVQRGGWKDGGVEKGKCYLRSPPTRSSPKFHGVGR
jgi:hypothetical protein